MPLKIVNSDITRIVCDAIVNPTDAYFSGSGGTDLAIHCAAGEELDKCCHNLIPLDTGEVVSTPGWKLPARFILHTRGPVWKGGGSNETILLRSCYLNALLKARSMNIRSIAFPLISSGTFGFPKDRVLRIAIDAISDYLNCSDNDMDVSICILNKDAYVLNQEDDLIKFLRNNKSFESSTCANPYRKEDEHPCQVSNCVPLDALRPKAGAKAKEGKTGFSSNGSLDNWIRKKDDTFAVTLLKLIDKKGMDDVDCYKKANVTKSTFYKIRNVRDYKPSKATVLAFAIALQLNLEETEQLLKTAGFTLSHSNIADLIVEFYISNAIYDIFEINSALYKYDQVPLGY